MEIFNCAKDEIARYAVWSNPEKCFLLNNRFISTMSYCIISSFFFFFFFIRAANAPDKTRLAGVQVRSTTTIWQQSHSRSATGWTNWASLWLDWLASQLLLEPASSPSASFAQLHSACFTGYKTWVGKVIRESMTANPCLKYRIMSELALHQSGMGTWNPRDDELPNSLECVNWALFSERAIWKFEHLERRFNSAKYVLRTWMLH